MIEYKADRGSLRLSLFKNREVRGFDRLIVYRGADQCPSDAVFVSRIPRIGGELSMYVQALC